MNCHPQRCGMIQRMWHEGPSHISLLHHHWQSQKCLPGQKTITYITWYIYKLIRLKRFFKNNITHFGGTLWNHLHIDSLLSEDAKHLVNRINTNEKFNLLLQVSLFQIWFYSIIKRKQILHFKSWVSCYYEIKTNRFDVLNKKQRDMQSKVFWEIYSRIEEHKMKAPVRLYYAKSIQPYNPPNKFV